VTSETSDSQLRECMAPGHAPPRSLRLSLSAAALLLCAAVVLGCATTSIKNRDWHTIETANFRIYSTFGAAGTRALATDLEAFGSAVVFLTGKPRKKILKTRVLAFDDRTLTRPFDLSGQPGYYLSSLRGGTIVLRTNKGWDGDATLRLRHLYAHDVFRNRVGLSLPLWLDEGVAQYLSTAVIHGHKAQLGLLREDHATLLGDRLGIDALELVNRRDRSGLSRGGDEQFDAASWALVHWLFSRGARGKPAWLRKATASYLKLMRHGRTPGEAFGEAFGVSIETVDDELIKYVRGDQFLGVPLQFSALPAELVATPLAPADALTELGWLAIRLGRAGTARRHFEYALQHDPRHPSATAGMGAAARLERDWSTAERAFSHSLTADSGDATILLESGMYRAALANDVADAERRHEHVQHARRDYQKSLAIDEGLPDTHAQLGASFLVAGEDASEGIPEAGHALDLMPSSLEALLLRARLEVASGKKRAAYGTATTVHAHTHDPSLAKAALEIVEAHRQGRTLIGR